MEYLKKNQNLFEIEDHYKQTFVNDFRVMVSEKEILKMYQDKKFTDFDVQLSIYIYKFKFITLSQIEKLASIHFPTIPIENIKKRLSFLVKNRVLNEFMLGEFELDKVAQGALRIYCLDFGGKYFTEAFTKHDLSLWNTSANIRGSVIIKQVLISNEFALRVMEVKGPSNVSYEKNLEFWTRKQAISPDFEINILNKEEPNKTYSLCGVVATKSDFPLEIRSTLEKMNQLLKTNAWKKYFLTHDEYPPMLLIICEDDITAFNVGKSMSRFQISDYVLTTLENSIDILCKKAFFKFDDDNQGLRRVPNIFE